MNENHHRFLSTASFSIQEKPKLAKVTKVLGRTGSRGGKRPLCVEGKGCVRCGIVVGWQVCSIKCMAVSISSLPPPTTRLLPSAVIMLIRSLLFPSFRCYRAHSLPSLPRYLHSIPSVPLRLSFPYTAPSLSMNVGSPLLRCHPSPRRILGRYYPLHHPKRCRTRPRERYSDLVGIRT